MMEFKSVNQYVYVCICVFLCNTCVIVVVDTTNDQIEKKNYSRQLLYFDDNDDEAIIFIINIVIGIFNWCSCKCIISVWNVKYQLGAFWINVCVWCILLENYMNDFFFHRGQKKNSL